MGKPNKFDVLQAKMQKSGKSYKTAEKVTAKIEKTAPSRKGKK